MVESFAFSSMSALNITFFFSPYFSNSDRILVKLISGQFWCPVMQHCLKHFFLTFYLKEERILRSLLISLRVGKMCL